MLKRPLRTAVIILLAAVVLALGSRWFFLRGQLGLATFTVTLAFLLCCGVIYLCAPFVVRSLPLPSFRLPLRFRVTGAGLVFVLAVFVVALSALISGNNLLYLVLSCMLGAMILSGLVSRLGLAGLQLNISFPRHIFAQQRSLAQVSVRNLKRWMPSFSIWVGASVSKKGTDVAMEEFYCPMITAGSVAVGSLPVTFGHRGMFHHRAVWLRSRFPFSFVERRTRLDLGREVLVYPPVASSPQVEAIVHGIGPWLQGSAPGDSHDLYRIRPAVSGESARFLDWKASARVGALMVREFSREDQRRLNIVFDRTVPASASHSKERFEKVVELCAAVVWRLHNLNAEICFTAEDETILSSPSSAAVNRIMRYLALVEPRPVGPGEAHGASAPEIAQGEWFQLIFSARPEAEWPALRSSKGHYYSPERL